MGIREYLEFNKAKKIKKDFDKILPTGVKCRLTYDADSYKPWKLSITNVCGAVKELSEKENDITDILDKVRLLCKRYYCSFTYSKYGLDYIYIIIDVKK